MKRRDFLATAGTLTAGMMFATNGTTNAADQLFEQTPLNYKLGDLKPLFSEEQVMYHYEKHHAAYLKNLQGLVVGKPEEKMMLEEIVIKARPAGGALFNNAAQLWNHNFFWLGLVPNGGGKPTGPVGKAIDRDFGDFEKFSAAFQDAANKQFASGWAWLVKDKKSGKLSIVTTSNAETPLGTDQKPLLTADVWEHAYYVDYRNRRADYLKAFFEKVNWGFVEENFAD